MPIVDAINKLITEHGSAEIMSKHLAFIRDQASALEKQNIELKERVAELEDLSRRLASEIKAKSVGEDFVKHRGVLFRKLLSGDYEDGVYCPKCKGPMSSLEGVLPFRCSSCNVTAGFKGEDMRYKIIPELKKNHG